jgi:hypothetical protein
MPFGSHPMTNTSTFYLARADECARAARDTKLENVRAQHLQSETVWRGMAARLLHGERLRAAAATQKDEML